MASNTSGLNTHAAMTPELMRDIRHRVQGMRQGVRLSDLDTDKQPSLILSGARGSFVRQQQEAFFRSASLSSSQSSLNSPTSNRSSLRSPTSPRNISDDEVFRRPSSVTLPRIPSKTLKARGAHGLSRQGDTSRPGEVTKRSGEEQERAGSNKIRRLTSRESQRSSWSSLNSDKQEASQASEVVLRRKAYPSSTLQRQDAVSSGGAGSRPSSASSGKTASAGSSRPTSSHSEKRLSGNSSRPTSSRSERNGSSSVSSPRGDAASFGRQDSNASDKSLRDKGQESGKEGDGRSQSGDGVEASRSSSRRGSEGSGVGANRHRPSFHTIQRSSTPVLQHHSMGSSSSSSPRSPPPAPLVTDASPNVGDTVLPFPSPPPALSFPAPTLPSLPPTPPPASPPPPPPVTEDKKQAADDRPPLFQPTPPSALSASPLPTPPSTPISVSDRCSQTEERIPSSEQDLPSPPLSPPDVFPVPPAFSGGPSSASSSSTSSKEQKSAAAIDFFNFLPDSLPHDDIEGHKPIKITTSSEAGAQITKDEVDGMTSIENTEKMIGEAKASTEKIEMTWTSAETTSNVAMAVQNHEEMKNNPPVPPPVIHFPPPPDYSPSLSPTLPSNRDSTTSPLSPTTPFSFQPDSSVSELESERRFTSTSTDVVLGYLDNALALYASAPPTPAPVRSPLPLSLPSPPDPQHDQPSLVLPAESDLNVQSTLPAIVLDSSEPQSSSSHDAQVAAESPTKAETFTTTSMTDPTTFLHVERVHIQKKKKGSKQSNRKLTPTQVTKYEGSVKTVRRQIKPGHVGELREFFIKQDDDDDDITVRHGKRRMSQPLLNGNSDDDNARSGYTTSSDNEYDLEHAEKINSPDYTSSSPFASSRMQQYNLNWEKQKSSTSLNTTSGDSTPKAKKIDHAFVFEKDLPPRDASGTHLKELLAQTASNRGAADVEQTPLPSTTSHSDSVSPHTTAVNVDYFTAPLLSPGTQQTENKSDNVVEAEVDKGEKVEVNGARDTTSLFFATPAVKTRSSSSESESSESDKEDRQSDTVSSPAGSKQRLPIGENDEGTTVQPSYVLTGLFHGDSNFVPSLHDSSCSAPETGPLLGDRHIMMDADDALGDNSSPSVKVKGGRGMTQEVDLPMEGRKGGESGLAAQGEREDSMTIFQPDDRNKDDRAKGAGENEGLTTALHVGSNFYDFPTAHSSTSSGPGVLEKDSFITHTVTTRGTGSSQHADTLNFSHPSSHTFSDTRQSAAELGAFSDTEGAEGGTADFLSILDDIQLESEGVSIDTHTAQRARQLHADNLKRDNRNSAEESVPKTAHTFQTDAQAVLSSAHSDLQGNGPDVASSSLILNGEKAAGQFPAVEVSSPELISRDEKSGVEPSGAQTTVRQTVVESSGDRESFTTAPASSPSPPLLGTRTVTVHDTNTQDTVFASDVGANKVLKTPPNGSFSEQDNKDEMTAVINERTSFSIRTKTAESSHSQKSSLSSSGSSSSLFSQGEEGNQAMFSSSQGKESSAGDMYVYRDSSGDVYVMQDVTDQQETPLTTESTTAIVRTADDPSASAEASLDLRRLSLNESVKVDTKGVDVKKAREVISAFFTDGASPKPVERKRHVKEESTFRVRGDQHEVVPNSQSQSSDFKVVAGNLSRNGTGQVHNPELHPTDVTAFTSGQTDTRDYSTRYQTSPSAANQQRKQSVTVSTKSTAVIGEESELQIQIPRNAVPVLPILPRRLNSTETTSDITPMVMDTPFPPHAAFTSSSPQASMSFSPEPYSYSSPHTFSSSSPNAQTVYDVETNHVDRAFTSQRTPDRHSSGMNVGRSVQSFELQSGLGDRTYTSQTTLERGSFASGTSDRDDRLHRSRTIDVSRLRKTSGSSLSSEEDPGDKPQYMITRLARTDSDKKDSSYSTDSTLKSSRQTLVSGQIYDSAASLPSYGRSSSQMTVINNTNTPHTNVSFGENDSQYGSQTSKTTSAADVTPTEDQLYRIVLAGKSMSSPTSPTRVSSPPPPQQQVIRQTLDKKTRATANYEQRKMNSSHEAIFRQNTGSSRTSEPRRVDRFSRSGPELSLPLLSKSLSTLPRREDEAGAQRYKLVQTGYTGRKVHTSSSESDDDSGVDGGKRYRTVSRVQVQGSSRMRSNSTGSIKKAELSLLSRSPPSHSRDYRVSKVLPQSAWEQNQERSAEPDGNLYRVTRVLSSEDLPQEVEKTMAYHTVGSVGTNPKSQSQSFVRDLGDENNNKYRPYRVVQTLPTAKTSITEEHVFRKSDVPRMRTTPSSLPRETQSFHDGLSHRRRPASPPPRAYSPGSGELHRTIINLKVNDDETRPATHLTETEGQHYRVVNVKSSDDNHGRDIKVNTASSVYPGHNQSFSSPVSGYESDIERSNSSSNKIEYSVNTLQQRPVKSRHENTSSPSGGRRYIVNKPQSSSTLEEGISAREDRPRVASPPLQSPTGEWHKTTIDFKCNPSIQKSDTPQTMAQLHQQQSKSYVVFNSLENIRDDRHHFTTTPPPLQRSNSQTFTPERMFRVMSPTPTTFTNAPYRGFLSGDFHPNLHSPKPTEAPRPRPADDDSSVISREVYEEKTYEVRQDMGHVMPEANPSEEEKDLRVLRGKILIQNRLDDSRDHDDILENMNVFDTSFHLGKDNPLYQSDPDIYKTLEAELLEQEQKSRTIGQEVTQDITWETVDRIAQRHQSGDVELSPKPRRKQNLSTMLLSKLASIDSKDLRQHIDVQHQNEEVYGDIRLVHADGSSASSEHTSNFDSVNENVELMLKEGKAFVIIKVIAERVVPIDYEFNVWRKSQAIVTRNIEIDLHATEQRRRLYEHVMETRGHVPGTLETGERWGGGATVRSATRSGDGEDERQLTSLETLRLFSHILDVAEKKGAADDTEMRRQQETRTLPETSSASSMDLLY